MNVPGNPDQLSESLTRGEILAPAEGTSGPMFKFLDFINERRNLCIRDYDGLHAWSTASYDEFWTDISSFFDVKWYDEPISTVQPHKRSMPGHLWWPGGSLNYVDALLRHAGRAPDSIAVIAVSQTRARVELTWKELVALIGSFRDEMIAHDLTVGDRVAAYLPNTPEAVAIFFAAASLGITFSSCPPEFGAEAVVSRFGQIDASLLYFCDAYQYGTRHIEKSADIAAIRAAMPTLRAAIHLELSDCSDIQVRTQHHASFISTPVPTQHPLYVLYSSGTTGLPKAIVHSHGGILHEHLKVLALHHGLDMSQRFFWFSTTGWMMWNYLVSGLLLGSSIVLFDGDPAFPDLGRLWSLARDERISVFGVGASFIHACMKANLKPRDLGDFSDLRIVGSTGSPLTADGFRWITTNVKSHLRVHSISGGTDVCSAFVGMSPMLPIRAGEMSCSILGADVKALRPDGTLCPRGETGELVIITPMPSMPTGFLNDPNGEKYHAAYFADYPGLWRHGDWITFTQDGHCVVSGRSDATLNRGGVRLGTSEFYGVVESNTTVSDSLVVHLSDGTEDGELLLFVVAKDDATQVELEMQLKTELRTRLSPRHVPDEIIRVAAVPRTLSGKKLEVPVKKILLGADPDDVCSRSSLMDPAALDEYVKIRERKTSESSSTK